MLFIMRDKRGFTLIETLMVVSLIGILASLSILPVGDTLDQSKYELTLNQMKQIRNALVGELNSTSTKSRFGYLGDVGGLPSAAEGLKALWEQTSGISSWQMTPEFRIGSGWNGPYLFDQGISGVDYTKDAWGNSYLYDPDSDPATLTSYGADLAAGGSGLNSDITLTIPKNRQSYSVHGLILDNGDPWSGSLEVEINLPDPTTGDIVSKSSTIVSGDQGAFLFDKITPGIRSLTFYLPTKNAPTVTYGPYIITVDQPHTLVIYGTAGHQLDLSAAP
jgi:type II secretion system protein G